MPECLPFKRPATPDDLAALVRTAAQQNTQVKITGSDSQPLVKFDDARPIQPVSTLRMNKVLEHAVSDMTVAVQAGITLEALQRQLAWHDQWLPVDPPAGAGRSPGARTIGGLIATNSLGPLRYGLAGGDWRRLILGMRWVDASGRLIKGGGQTVKNVAGYSSPRMMIGSAGTLGVIAELTLRTLARPADERCVIFFCDRAALAEELLAEIMVSATTPDYLQLAGGRTWRTNPLGLPAPAEVPGALGSGGSQAMVVVAGFLGRAETCGAQVQIVRGLPAARDVEAIEQTAAQAGRLRLWMTTEPAMDGETESAFRLHGASSAVAGLVGQIERAENAWVVSEAGSGVVRAGISGGAGRALAAELAKSHGGNFLLTRGGGGNFLPASRNPLVERLKNALDPQGVFGKMP